MADAIFSKWFEDKINTEQRIKVFEDVTCYNNVLALLFLVFVSLLLISWFNYVCFMKHLIGLQALWLDGSSTNELSNLKLSTQIDIN